MRPSLGATRHAEPGEDLAHPLAGNAQVVADLLERLPGPVTSADICLSGVVAATPRHAPSLGGLSNKRNSLTKCADERQSIAFLGMAAPVSEDSEATSASALFKRLIDESDWTHESFAAAVDVSPGRVSQWATNRGSVPWDKARLVAEKLGTKPALISPGFRRLRDEFLSSHLQRLDAEIISASQVVARQVAELAPGQRLSLDRHGDAIAEGIRLTLRRAIELSEGGYDESTQGDGADRRIDRAARKGEVSRQSAPAAAVARKRAAGGS